MTAAARRPGRRHQRGQALLELAITVPLLLTLTLGGYDISRAFGSQGNVLNDAAIGLQAAVSSPIADVGAAIQTASLELQVPADGWGLGSEADTATDAEHDCTSADQHCGDPEGCVSGSSFWQAAFEGSLPVACFAVRTCIAQAALCDPGSTTPGIWTAWSAPTSRPMAVLDRGTLGPGIVDVRVAERVSPLFPLFSVLDPAGITLTADAVGMALWNPMANVGVTDAVTQPTGDFDFLGDSYQGAGLTAGGLAPGATVDHDGLSFTWPAAAAGAPDNLVSNGQTVATWAKGDTLGVLGAATQVDQTQTVTITYADGTVVTDTLALSDWSATTPEAGNDLIASAPELSALPATDPAGPVSVFYAGLPLDPGREVAAITFNPAAVGFEPAPEPPDGSDPLGWAWGQCTAYVALAAPWIQGLVTGNADAWLSSAAAHGLLTTQVPAVGDVVVFDPGQSGASEADGHVAVVASVGVGSFVITEGNGTAGLDQVDQRTITIGVGNYLGFIEPPAGGVTDVTYGLGASGSPNLHVFAMAIGTAT
jgi:hypothetical protein